jgi:hypothetical protein
MLAKGFVVDQTHHEMFWLVVAGKKTSVRTRISQGAREYGDGLLAAMSRQMGLPRTEFDRFIECSLSANDYLTILTNSGRIRL